MAIVKLNNSPVAQQGRESITRKTLSSQWHSLSPYLIGSFYEVDRDGYAKIRENEVNTTVNAAVTECVIDFSLAWNSPLEDLNPSNAFPTLFAMLQSGAVQPVIDILSVNKLANRADKISSNLGFDNSGIGNAIRSLNTVVEPLKKQSKDYLKQFEGRTGITKLNSTQVFSGMPPVKIQMTLLFRAWQDAYAEVEEPLNQLMAWALPQSLAKDSLAPFIKAVQEGADPVEVLLPSLSPVLVGFQYKKRLYAPMVIENISIPLHSPVDSNGDFVELLIQMNLCSLTAWDKKDWENLA